MTVGTLYPKGNKHQRGRPKKLPKNLKSHLKAIVDDVTWLNHFYEVFLQFNDIVQQSPVKSKQSDHQAHFYIDHYFS